MKKEFTIGVSVIVAVLILVFGINYLKGVNLFQASNSYTAVYTNVAGLTQSAPVTVNGLKVGIVRDLAYEYDNPGHVRVRLDLDDNLKLTRGTEAVIVTDMLGTSTVALKVPGGNDFIKPGDEIKGVTAAGLMDNLGGELLPSVTALLPKLDSILTAVNTIISDPALVNSVRTLDRTMGNIETSSRTLNTFMASMPPMAKDASAMMGNLSTVSADLTEITAKLKGLPVDSTMNNVAEASAALRTLLAQLNDPNSTLGALTHDRQLYNNLNNSAASLDSLLRDVKKNPKRYISIKVF